MSNCIKCGLLRHIGQLLNGVCGSCCCTTRDGAIAWVAKITLTTKENA